jgi:hypothetical protein
VEPEGSLPCSQELTTGPYILSQMNPVLTFSLCLPRSLELSVTLRFSGPCTAILLFQLFWFSVQKIYIYALMLLSVCILGLNMEEACLQMWRVDLNVLNNQSRTTNKGWSYSFLHNVHKASYFSGSCEHGNEPSRSIKGGEFLD